jgi:hypothetical protein
MTMSLETSTDWRMLMEATLIPPAERLPAVERASADPAAAVERERPASRAELAELIRS